VPVTVWKLTILIVILMTGQNYLLQLIEACKALCSGTRPLHSGQKKSHQKRKQSCNN